MRFTPHFLDEIRGRLPVSAVVGRKVPLKRAGREWRGLSPFKAERTPSFFVNDQKGFYHCFSSGEHGDIFTFVMKTEGLSFGEAVERLAQEAGLPLPASDPAGQQRADERQRLHDLIAESAAFFRARLAGPEGAEARRYLDRRGLDRDAIDAFGLGYAPNSRSALKEHLARSGFTAAELAASGMVVTGEDIPVSYDRFRHRVMFPISDLKDRPIAFGGRALDPSAPAKYLNSPETPLFHKGAVLFNAARARKTAHDKGELVVVEGYMDVVALAQAGIAHVVAPLGTALTEDQIRLLWRFVREPVLCFDGDGAGRRAAFRALDNVLPHLTPGSSLRFAFLPDGLDPDDLVRQQGPQALSAILAAARPLADILWEREWASGDWSTPERRALLERQVRLLAARIEDPSVRAHYQQMLRERLRAAFGATDTGARYSRAPAGARLAAGPARQGRTPHPSNGRSSSRYQPQLQAAAPVAPASESLRRSALVAGNQQTPGPREVLLLKALVNHPWLIEAYAERIAALPLAAPGLQRLRDALLMLQAGENQLDRATLRSQLTRLSLDTILDTLDRALTHRSDRFAEPDADEAEVENGWRHTLALHDRHVTLRADLQAARLDFERSGSWEAEARIIELQKEIARAESAESFASLDAHRRIPES